MSVTVEDIANMALGVLDEAPIDSLEDDNKPARLMKLHFDLTREVELSKYTWVFATFSAEVTGTDTGSGSGTLNWAYDVPADCLRVLPLTYNGEPDGVPISWRQEAGVIYTDQESPRIIRYIGNLAEPDDWNALFTDVLIAALAVKIALPLTHKSGMVDIARAAYDRAVEAALSVNAMERSGGLYLQGWSSERGDNRFWRP